MKIFDITDERPGEVADVPQYHITEPLQETLVAVGYLPEFANSAFGEVINDEIDLNVRCSSGWKTGYYMVAWDKGQDCWACFNFPMCNN